MALKRVLALLVAAGLIVGAFQLRDRREEQQAQPAPAQGPAGAPTEQPATPAAAGEQVLGCLPELRAVCESLHDDLVADGWDLTLSVEDDLDALAAERPDASLVVLTFEPFAGRLDQRSGASSEEGSPPLGRSPLVVAIWDDRAEVLLAHCGELSWRCVGEATAPPASWEAIGGPADWGPIKPAFDDPARSAGGRLVLGQMAAGYFDTAEVSSGEVDNDPGFYGWLDGMGRAVAAASGGPSTLEQAVTFGPSRHDLVGVVEAEASGFLAQVADRAATLRLRAVEPVASADVVAVPMGAGPQVEELMGEVVALAPAHLAEAGWRVEGQAPSEALTRAGVGDIDLPESSGLPSAGTLEALRRTWAEVAR